MRNRDRNAGLADPPRTNDGNEFVRRQLSLDFGDGIFSTDHARQSGGQHGSGTGARLGRLQSR
jgi:hypothetical protein